MSVLKQNIINLLQIPFILKSCWKKYQANRLCDHLWKLNSMNALFILTANGKIENKKWLRVLFGVLSK